MTGQLVWRVLLPSATPLASFEVLVDVHTGEVVRIQDLLRRATGNALLFDPNPVEWQGSSAGLADANDADSPLLTSLRTPMSLPRLSDVTACASNPFALVGQWVRATLPTNASCPPDLDFSAVTRQDDRFESLMAYAHLDRVQTYLQSLGFTNVLNRQQLVNANVVLPGEPDLDNSFFDPATGEIGLGPGGVDDGEDADVIVHEYGHAIQEDQVPGFGFTPESGAIGEGFGDYLAAAISATFTPGPSFDVCMGEWNTLGFSATLGCMRRIDDDPTVAEVRGPPCNAEIHCAGVAWSSALWDIRSEIGAQTTDRLVIQSHFSLTASSGFHEASLGLLAADAALYGGVHQSFIRGILLTRGLFDVERMDDTPAEAVPLAVPGDASGTLNASSDRHDVYRMSLLAGQGVLVALTGAGDFDLRLYSPGTASLQAGTVADSIRFGTSSESITYVPTVSGDFFLDVAAAQGSGSYTLQVSRLDRDGDGRPDDLDNCSMASNPGQEDIDADGLGDVCDRFPQDAANDVDRDGFGANVDNCPTASNPGQEDIDRDGLGDVCDRFPQDAENDADRDGIGANRDNCPRVSNPGQADWNRNRRGDACDRAARIELRRVRITGRTATITGSVLPVRVDSGVRVLMTRRICRGRSCRHRQVGRLTNAAVNRGSFRARTRIPQGGQYRFQAVLRDRDFTSAKSQFVFATVRR